MTAHHHGPAEPTCDHAIYTRSLPGAPTNLLARQSFIEASPRTVRLAAEMTAHADRMGLHDHQAREGRTREAVQRARSARSTILTRSRRAESDPTTIGTTSSRRLKSCPGVRELMCRKSIRLVGNTPRSRSTFTTTFALRSPINLIPKHLVLGPSHADYGRGLQLQMTMAWRKDCAFSIHRRKPRASSGSTSNLQQKPVWPPTGKHTARFAAYLSREWFNLTSLIGLRGGRRLLW